MLTEMATQVEAVRFLTYHAAWRKQTKMPFSKEAAMTKFFASEAAVRCVGKAVQIHGGHG